MTSNRSRTRSKIRKRKHDAEISFVSVLSDVYSNSDTIAQNIANEITRETISDIPKELIQLSDIQDNSNLESDDKIDPTILNKTK